MDDIVWNIETTNRYKYIDTKSDLYWFVSNFKNKLITQDINEDYLFKFLNQKNNTVYFSGRGSDPILHPKFKKIIEYFKDKKTKIIINTHGVGRNIDWWQNLSPLLDKDDSIVFLLDNKLLKEEIIKKVVSTVLDLSPCKKNLQTYENTQTSAEFKKNFKFDFHRIKENEQIYKKPVCMPQGHPNFKLYIDCFGNFYPCCWIGGYRYQYSSIFNPKFSNFNIKNNSIEDILENKEVKIFFKNIKQKRNVHKCCEIKCSIN